jgi:hypothetical protein
VHGHLAEAYLALGQNKDAVEATWAAAAHHPALQRQLQGFRPNEDIRSLLQKEAEWNEARHAAGEPAEGSGIVAYIWAAAGNREKALHWLGMAIDARDYNALFVLRYPYWDAFHGEPRFEAALARMGLQGDPRIPALLKARNLA